MIVTDHKDSLVSLSIYGEFSLSDFQEFEELVRYKIKFGGPIDLYVDLRQMADFSVDVAWQEIRLSRAHGDDFRRIAVLTHSQWVTWSAWLQQAFVQADLRIFDDEAAALAWLSEAAE